MARQATARYAPLTRACQPRTMSPRQSHRYTSVLCRALLAVQFLAAGQGVAGAASEMAQGPANFVALGRPVLGPLAYTHFCMRYPAECRALGSTTSQPVSLVGTRAAELAGVNARVNRTIAPMRQVGDRSYDTWRLSPRAGDCNDYAVTKRHQLMGLGWPSRALLLSEVITPWGEHHLVLLVRTSAGDLVLDNLDKRIRRWDMLPYGWVRVQMPSEPMLWAVVTSRHDA